MLFIAIFLCQKGQFFSSMLLSKHLAINFLLSILCQLPLISTNVGDQKAFV